MKNRIFSFLDSSDNFSKILVITIVFYFYKVAFWPLTYLFVLSYVILLIFFLRNFKWNFSFIGYISAFKIPLILAGIFILEFLINRQFTYFTVLKDFMLISVLFSLYYFLHWNDKVLRAKISIKFTIDLIILTTVLISVYNLISQFHVSILPPDIQSQMNLSSGAAVAKDYNFFSLFILFGLILLNFPESVYTQYQNYPKWFRGCLNALFILNILLSSSRRGFASLILLVLIFFLISIYRKRTELKFKQYLRTVKLFVVVSLLIFICGLLLYRVVPRQKISNILYRYTNLFGYNNEIKIEKFLWSKELKIQGKGNKIIDSASLTGYPNCWSIYSSEGSKISYLKSHYGNAVKVSRNKGDEGGFSLYYVGPKIIYYSEHTYRIRFKIKFIKGSFNSFNVGWWITDRGKGVENTAFLKKDTISLSDGWYSCSSSYTFIDSYVGLIGFINSVKNQSEFIIADFTLDDLDYNPEFPKYVFEIEGDKNLSIWTNEFYSNWDETNLISNGDFSHELSCWNHSQGSAIETKASNIKDKNCCLISRGDGDDGGWSLYYDGKDIEYNASNEYQISFMFKPVQPDMLPCIVGFWVDEGGGYQIDLKKEIDTMKEGWYHVTANYRFKQKHHNLLFPLNSQIDNSKFYVTDLSLVNLTQRQLQAKPEWHINNVSIDEPRFNERTSRWSFALDMWRVDYNWYNKIFGRGFSFLRSYGEKYLGNPNLDDWPHNPFLSILLYSGIIGILMYLFLLFNVVWLYINHLKKFSILFIGFIMTFFFSFFSGSHPFDPPVMGFFILFPFYINNHYKSLR
jgi:hypothetical protein